MQTISYFHCVLKFHTLLLFLSLSSPTSNSDSSVASCSDLVAALEALTIELQQRKQEEEEQAEEVSENREEMMHRKDSGGAKTLTRDNCSETTLGRMSPVKSLGGDSGRVKFGDVAEKEKILNECKVQIKVSHSSLFFSTPLVCSCNSGYFLRNEATPLIRTH